MRAIYKDINLEDISIPHVEQITGEEATHLSDSARIKIGEDLVVLNGRGDMFFGVVSSIVKKNVIIEIHKHEFQERNYTLDLALCLPKKEATESIIKQSVELGFRSIIPLTSDYSQIKDIRKDRAHRMLVSAMKQSNNPYLLNVLDVEKLKNYDFTKYDQVFYFSSTFKQSNKIDVHLDKASLILIGPEGGLSSSEEQLLLAIDNIRFIHLKTPILRSPTAVSCAMGYLLAKSDSV